MKTMLLITSLFYSLQQRVGVLSFSVSLSPHVSTSSRFYLIHTSDITSEAVLLVQKIGRILSLAALLLSSLLRQQGCLILHIFGWECMMSNFTIYTRERETVEDLIFTALTLQ
jgi:hypothetical protein